MKFLKKRFLPLFIASFLFMTGGCSAASEDSQESSPSAPLPAPAALESYALPDWTSAPPPDPIPTSSQTTEHTEEATEEKTARIAFAGDTTQSDIFGEVTDTHGIAYPFEDVAPIFREADLSFVNLETSVSTRGESEKPEGYGFRSDPAHLEIYRDAGIDLVSCANNHTRDYGTEALVDTLFHLREIGIDQVGAGETLSEAGRLAVYDLNGIKVGFTACNMINMNPTWYAGEDHAGIRCVDFADCADYLAEIAEYDGLCDVLFVSVHWGIEYTNAVTSEQSDFAHLLCDSGADVILGGHPHVLQPIEHYNGSMIFYSLGNFLFYKMDDDAGKTAVFEIEIDRNGFRGGKLSPVFIQYCKSNLLAESDPMYEEILTLVRTISEPYGVSVGEKGEISTTYSGGCAVQEAQVQQHSLPTAAYISHSSETESLAPETDHPESAETSEAPAPVTKETEAEPAPRTEPVPKGEITLLGANMVYTGEKFTYSYELSEAPEPPEIVWECGGDAGSITSDGEFTAIRKGTAELTVTDRANHIRDTLTIHVVDTAADVDFVPEVNGIPIVNKTYPLPADYDPGDLLPEAYSAFASLVSAAAEEGIEITFLSGYRSYGYQKMVHDNWIEKYDGDEAGADRVSARAGHSEHQLGLAIDVNELVLEFAEKPEGIWLKENCTKFGFIIRYPRGSEPITGYIYEPWHIRYLGGELAVKVTESGLTLEEYLGIDSYYRDPTPVRPMETTAAEGAAEPQETPKDGA